MKYILGKHKYIIEIRLRQNTDTFLSVESLLITASLETKCEYIYFMIEKYDLNLFIINCRWYDWTHNLLEYITVQRKFSRYLEK